MKQLLIDFFNDIYNKFYKDFIIVNYCFPISWMRFQIYIPILISLNCPIKIYVKVPIDAFIHCSVYDFSYNDSVFFTDSQNVSLETFDLDKNIFGFDFYLYFEKQENIIHDKYCEETEYFIKPFLNKINKKFEDLEYVRIHSYLLSSLISLKRLEFLEIFLNNLKYILKRNYAFILF